MSTHIEPGGPALSDLALPIHLVQIRRLLAIRHRR